MVVDHRWNDNTIYDDDDDYEDDDGYEDIEDSTLTNLTATIFERNKESGNVEVNSLDLCIYFTPKYDLIHKPTTIGTLLDEIVYDPLTTNLFVIQNWSKEVTIIHRHLKRFFGEERLIPIDEDVDGNTLKIYHPNNQTIQMNAKPVESK